MFVLLTTVPTSLVAPIHDRMPVILASEAEALWLDFAVTNPLAGVGGLGPYPAGLMTGYPVSTAVNVVANDGPR